ncbi:MAG: DUF4256 domain-containing protein [Ignavibacteriaceae bacterium]
MNYYKNLERVKVQAKLEINTEKLWPLNEMKITGGEPDIVQGKDFKDEEMFVTTARHRSQGKT